MEQSARVGVCLHQVFLSHKRVTAIRSHRLSSSMCVLVSFR